MGVILAACGPAAALKRADKQPEESKVIETVEQIDCALAAYSVVESGAKAERLALVAIPSGTVFILRAEQCITSKAVQLVFRDETNILIVVDMENDGAGNVWFGIGALPPVVLLVDVYVAGVRMSVNRLIVV